MSEPSPLQQKELPWAEFPCKSKDRCEITAHYDADGVGVTYQHGSNPEHSRHFTHRELAEGPRLMMYFPTGQLGQTFASVIDWLREIHEREDSQSHVPRA